MIPEAAASDWRQAGPHCCWSVLQGSGALRVGPPLHEGPASPSWGRIPRKEYIHKTITSTSTSSTTCHKTEISINFRFSSGVTLLEPYLEEEFSAFFHDLLNLQEACSIHEKKLVSHCHAEAASVAESQNLLEALGLHCWWEFHYCGVHLITATTCTIAAVAAAEEVSEIRAASGKNSSMSLEQDRVDGSALLEL